MNNSYFSRKNRYTAFLFLSILLVVLMGISGYMLLEEISFLEALYMTIGTLTTVSPFTLSTAGKIFSILLLVVGFGLVAATAGYLGNLLLDENWVELHRRRKVQKSLKKQTRRYPTRGNFFSEVLAGIPLPVRS